MFGKTIPALLTLFALAVPARAGEGVWTPAGPPGTGTVISFTEDLVFDPFSPSTLYLLFSGYDASGVWKSTDGGRSWTSINAGLGSSFVHSLVADPFTPGTLYAVVDRSVMKSADGGRTWTEVFRGGRSFTIDTIFPDPAVPGVLWGLYDAQGTVFWSTDGGASWTVRGPAVDGSGGELAFDPLNSDVLYLARWDRLWKSVDRGAHWTAISEFNTFGFAWIEIAPSRPATLYARPTISGFAPCVRSDDGGVTWTPLSLPDDRLDLCDAVVVDPEDHLRIWTPSFATDRLYGSRDGGATWSEVHDGLPESYLADPEVRRHPETGIFYLAGPQGVSRSEDGGATWRSSRRGLTQGVVSTLLAVPAGQRTPLLAIVEYDISLKRSRNRGSFWTDLPLTFASTPTTDPRSPRRTLVAGFMGEDKGYGLHESRDGGTTWTFLGPVPGGVLSIAFPSGRSDAIAIGTANRGVFQSRDGGRSWQPGNGGLSLPPPCDSRFCDSVNTYDLTFDPRDPRVAHAIFSGKVVRSDNGGWRWRQSHTGMSGNFVVALERDPRHPQVLWAAGRNRLFKSLDGGATWSEIGRDIPGRGRPSGKTEYTDLTFDPRGDGILYAATRNQGVLRSRDGGATWEAINEGLPLLDVRVLAIDPSTPGGLFVGTGGAGIWEGRF